MTFEQVVIEKRVRSLGEPLVTINPKLGRFTFNAKACSVNKCEQFKHAVVYVDRMTREIAIELTNKDNVANSVPIKKTLGKASVTATFRAPQALERFELNETAQYPFALRPVKIKISDAFGDTDERQMFVIALVDGRSAVNRRTAAELKVAA